MLRIKSQLSRLAERLADRLAGEPAAMRASDWGLASAAPQCLPRLAPHNAWGWSPPNPPVAEALGPDDPDESPRQA